MHSVKKINFLQVAPYVRYIQEYEGADDCKLPPRIIYDHEVIMVIKGTCIYHIEDQEYTLRAGDIHFMRPHVQHSFHVPAGKSFHYYAVHFDLIYMGESLDFSADEIYVLDYRNIDHVPLEEDLLERPVIECLEVEFPYVFPSREPHLYIPLFRELLSLFHEKKYGYHLAMRAAMLRILTLMVGDVAMREGIGKEHSHMSNITEVIEYMYNNYQEEFDHNKLSQSQFLSPNYLRTLFKQATGKTPIEFLTHIRLEKAKIFLLEGKYSISQVSLMVGYQDIHYFSKLFKKVEGLSPVNYMKSLQLRRNSSMNNTN